MSMRDLVIDIQTDIELGVLSFRAIAEKHDVHISWVNEAWDMLCEQAAEAESYEGERYFDINDNWYDEQFELDY
ncbi:MAG: hypothetical protein ACKODS_02485 [Methylophilaceae bacterium]